MPRHRVEERPQAPAGLHRRRRVEHGLGEVAHEPFRRLKQHHQARVGANVPQPDVADLTVARPPEKLLVKRLGVRPRPQRAVGQPVVMPIAVLLVDVLRHRVHGAQVTHLAPDVPEPLDRQLRQPLRDPLAALLGVGEHEPIAAHLRQVAAGPMPCRAHHRPVDPPDQHRVGQRRIVRPGQKLRQESSFGWHHPGIERPRQKAVGLELFGARPAAFARPQHARHQLLAVRQREYLLHAVFNSGAAFLGATIAALTPD